MLTINNIRNKYTTEIALIILAGRVYLEKATILELNQYIINYKIDWNTVLTICRKDRVRPVIYKILLKAQIPLNIGQKIKEEFKVIIAQNWKLGIETDRIINLLNINQIQTVPYKGTAFSKQFYSDIVSRESSDIDFIIHPGDLTKIFSILESDGYTPELKDLYDYMGKHFFTYHKEFNFNRILPDGTRFHLEFHWGISYEYVISKNKINQLLYEWDDKVTLLAIPQLSLNKKAHGFAVFAHHFFQDNCYTLKHIFEISIFIKQLSTQCLPNEILANAKFLGISKALGTANQLSYNIFGIYLSNIEFISNSDSIVNFFQKQLLKKEKGSINAYTILKQHKYQIKLRHTLSDKINFLYFLVVQRFIPAYADMNFYKIPRQFFFLYFLLKPIRTLLMPTYKINKKTTG